MIIDRLGSRAVIALMVQFLAEQTLPAWITGGTMFTPSNQLSEIHAWLGDSPQLRKWIGPRLAKELRENGLTIQNEPFEASIHVSLDDLRRDKSTQLRDRINKLSFNAQVTHWAKILTELIEDGEDSTCYDGQFFFDTDHSEDDSGTLSNDITSAVVLKTAPSVSEMSNAIFAGLVQMLKFKSDTGEPMNEDLMRVAIMVPPSFMKAALGAVALPLVTNPATTGVESNALGISGFILEVVVNARLSWTDKFMLLRNDGINPAFIRQQENDVNIKAKAEGSDYEFDNDGHQYGVDTSRAVGYALWQSALLYTFTTT
jgi:phage major head subunit gpT-like protein